MGGITSFRPFWDESSFLLPKKTQITKFDNKLYGGNYVKKRI